VVCVLASKKLYGLLAVFPVAVFGQRKEVARVLGSVWRKD